MFSSIDERTSFSMMMSPFDVSIETESILLLFSIFLEIVSKSVVETVTEETFPETFLVSKIVIVSEPDETAS